MEKETIRYCSRLATERNLEEQAETERQLREQSEDLMRWRMEVEASGEQDRDLGQWILRRLEKCRPSDMAIEDKLRALAKRLTRHLSEAEKVAVAKHACDAYDAYGDWRLCHAAIAEFCCERYKFCPSPEERLGILRKAQDLWKSRSLGQ